MVLPDWAADTPDAEAESGSESIENSAKRKLRKLLDRDQSSRIGQLPTWLSNATSSSDEESSRNLVTPIWHSNIWNTLLSPIPESLPDLRIRRDTLLRQSLPTYNSFSIEAQLWNIEGMSDQYVYMNGKYVGRDTRSFAMLCKLNQGFHYNQTTSSSSLLIVPLTSILHSQSSDL